MKRKGMGFWRVQKSARKCKRVRRQREIKEIDEVKGITEARIGGWWEQMELRFHGRV
jgi:hypothetical protein